MLEARLAQASVLKRTLDAIKDLVSDANLDCDDNGLKLQSMDQAHVALVALALRSNAFEPYRCDSNINLGMSLGSLSKIIKCAGNDDVVTLKAEDNKDKIHIMLEAQNNDRLSEYSLKLMDIDAEHYGIPETEYDATVRM
ncbi:proliferating cell nuclear antigen, partial [Caulochytrium protostelioides]